MTQPNPFMPAPPTQQPPNPYVTNPPAPTGPYGQQPQAPVNPYAQQPVQPQNGGSPWPQGATAGAPGLVAAPGQFVRPAAPPPPGQGAGAKVSDLKGRLLIVLPESVRYGVPSKFNNADGTAKTQDIMIATVIVLDGGPLRWGATPQNPAGKVENVPHVIKGCWIPQTGLIVQLDPALKMRQSGQAGIALGRLWQVGNAQTDPYVLAEPSPEDVQVYNQYVSQVNPFAL